MLINVENLCPCNYLPTEGQHCSEHGSQQAINQQIHSERASIFLQNPRAALASEVRGNVEDMLFEQEKKKRRKRKENSNLKHVT